MLLDSPASPVSSCRYRLLILLLCCSWLLSCSVFRGDRDEFAGLTTEEQFYRRALGQLNSSNFERAIATYQALESRFPFGRFSAQAQVEIVYAHYRSGDVEATRAAADRFIRLHPDDQNVDYAHYMKGLASFADSGGALSRLLPVDPTKRDPGRAEESFADFSQLLQLYPDSPYSADARARMVFLRNNLAAYEIHVADYYMERRAYVAALRRAQYVVERFQGTPAVADGLAIMVECYLRLALDDLAATSLALLKDNYPDHSSLNSDGEFEVRLEVTDPSLLYTITFGLLGNNRGDPPLAPTVRPINSGNRQVVEDQLAERRRRSFWSIITFGIFD